MTAQHVTGKDQLNGSAIQVGLSDRGTGDPVRKHPTLAFGLAQGQTHQVGRHFILKPNVRPARNPCHDAITVRHQVRIRHSAAFYL